VNWLVTVQRIIIIRTAFLLSGIGSTNTDWHGVGTVHSITPLGVLSSTPGVLHNPWAVQDHLTHQRMPLSTRMNPRHMKA